MPARPRFTLWGMMVAVALAALCLAVVRGFLEPSLAAGASIVGGCLALMTARLARDRLARERAAGTSSGRRRTVLVAMDSAGWALIMVVTGNFSCFFVAIVFGFLGEILPLIGFIGLALSLFAAVWVTSRLRKRLLTEISFGPLEIKPTQADGACPDVPAGATAAEPSADLATPEA